MTDTQLYACLRYHDADAALAFLAGLGFEERLVVRDENDPTNVVHAQLRWRDTGGIMLGSVRDDGERGFTIPAGTACINLVVPADDDVNATIDRAVAMGAVVAQEPYEPPHGGRTGMVRDLEGNLRNIDSYPGE